MELLHVDLAANNESMRLNYSNIMMSTSVSMDFKSRCDHLTLYRLKWTVFWKDLWCNSENHVNDVIKLFNLFYYLQPIYLYCDTSKRFNIICLRKHLSRFSKQKVEYFHRSGSEYVLMFPLPSNIKMINIINYTRTRLLHLYKLFNTSN